MKNTENAASMANMENTESKAKTYICLMGFEPFDPEEYSALYTKARKWSLERTVNERTRMQSAAAELAFLAAAKAARAGGLLSALDCENAAQPPAGSIRRFEYAYAQNGRPVLSGAYMSLSHTDGAALAAVSSAPVGADIERERRVNRSVAKRIMGEQEYAEFIALGESEGTARILECWTAKESSLKLTGEGIAAGMGRICYDFEAGTVLRAQTRERARIIRLDSEGFFACVCQKEAAKTEILRFCGADEAARFILGQAAEIGTARAKE